MGKCKVCGKNAENDYCFQHKPRKPMKTSTIILNTNLENALKFDKILKQSQFFMDIWTKRPHKSEISGEYLGKEPLSSYFHHILSKSKYSDLELIEENIILLTLDEHANVESDMYKYEEINTRRKLLKTKYNI